MTDSNEDGEFHAEYKAYMDSVAALPDICTESATGTCNICSVNGMNVINVPCGHMFCTECIRTMAQITPVYERPVCPHCNCFVESVVFSGQWYV